MALKNSEEKDLRRYEEFYQKINSFGRRATTGLSGRVIRYCKESNIETLEELFKNLDNGDLKYHPVIGRITIKFVMFMKDIVKNKGSAAGYFVVFPPGENNDYTVVDIGVYATEERAIEMAFDDLKIEAGAMVVKVIAIAETEQTVTLKKGKML